MIRINEAPLPSPTEFRLTYREAQGQKQLNALGQTVRDVLGKKRRLEVGYKRLSGDTAQNLLVLLPKDKTLKVHCPTLEGDTEFMCYCEQIQCALFHRDNEKELWADVAFVLEEV